MKNLLITILLVSSSILYAQKSVISFLGSENKQIEKPRLQINDQGLSGITVIYNFKTALIENKIETLPNGKKTEFQHISIPDFSHLQTPGQAALPAHIDLIAVPKGADYQLEITNITRQLQKDIKIYPAREPAVDTEGAPEPEFVFDEDFYKTNSFFPANPIEIIETIEMRGMTYLLVQVTPIQYNPAKSEIYKIIEVKYKVNFSGATSFLDYEHHSKNFINTLTATPLNSEGFKSDFAKWNGVQTSLHASYINTDYLIITQDALMDAADSLANWKRQMGYGVEIISSSSWTAAAVKTAIHNKYQNQTVKPDYFVILGDVAQVPADMFVAPDASGNYGTDLYYACMGGSNDYVPEMAHGRISVNSATQAMTVVQKIINYERNPINDSSFYQNGINCAQFQDDDNNGYADRRFTHTSEDVRDYMLTKGYDIQRIYYTDNNVFPYNYNASYYSNGQTIPSALLKTNGFNWNGGANDIKNSINAGKFYVLHRDHGYVGGSGWVHPYFVNGNINQLSNGNKLPVVFSINCHTGEFTLNSCFAETFLRHSNGGAVGIFAASYYSYSGFNDGLTPGLFDAIWSSPGLIPVFGTGGNSNPQTTAHADIINMGFVLNHGLLRMTQTWGGGANGREYTYRLFHYFGDPAMVMWTEQPQNLTATHAASINCTDTTFVITNCSDSLATATLTFNGQLLGKGQIINGSGSIYLPLIIGQNLKLTITSRNHIPYIANIIVNSGGGLGITSTVTHNSCYGDSIGSIRILPSCGNPPYQINWSDNSTALYRENLPGGVYIVTVTDSTNASLTDTLSVWSPSAPLVSFPVIKDAKCYFQSSGEIELNLSGGAQPYKYQWSNGYTGALAQNLAAGSINVTVTDSAGCEFTQGFTINQPLPLDLTANSIDDNLNNCTGTGEAIVTGGIQPYTYAWNDPSNQTTAVATGLCKGVYKVTVNDSNQCVQYRTIIIDNTAGINQNEFLKSINIYPNPADNHIYIKGIDSQNSKLYIRLYNTLGQELMNTQKDFIQNEEVKVDLNNLSNGIYYILIENQSGEIYNQKIIINRI